MTARDDAVVGALREQLRRDGCTCSPSFVLRHDPDGTHVDVDVEHDDACRFLQRLNARWS